MSSALAKPLPDAATAASAGPIVGAVVVGGDYQGLGIVRSLGRRGVPVCVVDDEMSISRFSKYCTHFVRLANLRDEREAVNSVIDVAKRLGLVGMGPVSNPGRTRCRLFSQSF